MLSTKTINNQSSINNFGNDVSINGNLIILDDSGNSTTITPASGILPVITTLSALIVNGSSSFKSDLQLFDSSFFYTSHLIQDTNGLTKNQ